MAFKHGVEQELQLIDLTTGSLRRDVRDRVIESLRSGQGSHAFAGYGPDGFPTQLEYWVGIARSLAELEGLLAGFRRVCLAACDTCGVGLVALGVNPVDRTDNDGENFGEHHHVGVASADEARRFHNLVRLFVPELIALSANSRWYGGDDTATASFRLKRTHHCGPAPWLPPSAVEEIVVASKRVAGKNSRRFWDVTPFVKGGRTTVEVRLFDVGPSIGLSLGVAAILQALVNRLRAATAIVDEPLSEQAESELAQNRQAAIAGGLDARFARRVHPLRGGRNSITAREALQDLFEWLDRDLAAIDPAAHRWTSGALGEAECAQATMPCAGDVWRSALQRTRQT